MKSQGAMLVQPMILLWIYSIGVQPHFEKQHCALRQQVQSSMLLPLFLVVATRKGRHPIFIPSREKVASQEK